MTIFFVLFGSPLIDLFKMMITRKLGCLHVVFSFPVKPEVPVLLTPLLPIVAIDSVFLILSKGFHVVLRAQLGGSIVMDVVCMVGKHASLVHVRVLRIGKILDPHVPSLL